MTKAFYFSFHSSTTLYYKDNNYELEVESIPGKGTRVHMWKKMRCGDWIGKED